MRAEEVQPADGAGCIAEIQARARAPLSPLSWERRRSAAGLQIARTGAQAG